MSESPASRRSSRSAAASARASEDTEDENLENKTAKKAAKKPAAKKAAPKKSPSKKKEKRKSSGNDDSDIESVASDKPKKKRAKAPPHQRITERDPLPKLWDSSKASEGSYSKFTMCCRIMPLFGRMIPGSQHSCVSLIKIIAAFKIASWNVAGLRALLKKTPTALTDLVHKHNLDVLCLQETKLQETHLTDPKLKLNGGDLIEGYDAYWSCSTSKKGYSGTAVFVKKRGDEAKKGKQTTIGSFFTNKNATGSDDANAADGGDDVDEAMAEKLVPTEVTYEMEKEHDADAEGRIITLDFPLFSFSNVYVPNSGQKLERLTYRTDTWDKHLLEFAQQKQAARGVPVMWLGDLNVAHTNLEVWNDGAKHLPKQAGVTPQERASFQEQLDAGFVDAFRHLHPTAQGHYSYWSQRAGNREPNKGLRLDYFICSQDFLDGKGNVVVRDSYMIPEQGGSDHCPVVLELEIKK